LAQRNQEILHRGVQLRQPIFLQGLQSDPFKFLLYGCLSAPQFRRSISQIVQSDQVLLISVEQLIQLGSDAFGFPFQPHFALLHWIIALAFLDTALDFSSHELWLVEQLDDFLPYQFVELILANRPALACRPTQMTIPIRTQAPIILDLPFGSLS